MSETRDPRDLRGSSYWEIIEQIPWRSDERTAAMPTREKAEAILMARISENLEDAIKASSTASHRLSERVFWLNWVLAFATLMSALWGMALAVEAWLPHLQ